MVHVVTGSLHRQRALDAALPRAVLGPTRSRTVPDAAAVVLPRLAAAALRAALEDSVSARHPPRRCAAV
jgi:hypothetical protein